MARIFLAHAGEDKPAVRQIHQRLQAAGLQPWLDEIDLLPGQNWRVEIPKAIRACDIFVACLSRESVAKQGYVQKEFRIALDTYAEKPPGSVYLIPLKLDECEIPDLELPEFGVRLRDIQWLDYWKSDGFERLVTAIGGGRPAAQPGAVHDESLSALERAVAADDGELANTLLKKILWTYAGEEAVRRGYIDTLEEANRVPCRVLQGISEMFGAVGERDGGFYLFKTYRKHPGEAWGGYKCRVWLGNAIGYRLDECGATTLRT